MTTKEVSIHSKLFDEVLDKITQTYPNACVLYIEEIIHLDLEAKYNERKEKILEARGEVKELELFHGTSYKTIDSIIQTGFNPSRNKRSAYGVGTYFATHSAMSKLYTDMDAYGISYLFLTKVLIGNCCVGRNSLVIDTKHYDNAVDNLHKPSMYVTPYEDGALPKYLIAFHKNAK